MDARVIEKASTSQIKSTNDRAVLRIPPIIRLMFQLGWRISPRLGAEIARQLFFHPVRAPYRDEQRAKLALSRRALLPIRHGHVYAIVGARGR